MSENPIGSFSYRQFKLTVMNLAFAGHQFTYKAKNTKTPYLKLFHTKILIFANFNMKNLFILILCFLTFEKITQY